MIHKCNCNEIKVLEEYIGEEYSKCLYLFLNLKKYGITNSVTSAYIQYDGDKISSILLTYYSCIHLYSKDNEFNVQEIIDFCVAGNFSMIYCTRTSADRVWIKWPKSINANITHGWVAQIEKIDKPGKNIAVRANFEDYYRIAKLIFDDEDIGKSYKYHELEEQLRERANEGYSRNLVIKQNNIIVAHACTNAEYENIAVVAELLVDRDYRKQGYGSDIWRTICQELLEEKKEVFSFYYTDDSRNLHKKIGFYEVCEWGKIVIEL